MTFFPNVTQVLGCKHNNSASASSMLRGKILHLAIKALAKKDWRTLEKVRNLEEHSIGAYWRASETCLEGILSQSIKLSFDVPLISKKYQYRGKADLLAKNIDGTYNLFEFKSSSQIKERSLYKESFKQLAAYQQALRESKMIDAKAVLFCLYKNSSPDVFSLSKKELDVFFLMFKDGLR